MSKVINEVRHKLACGQNLFRRSTIEKILAEYDRLFMRNTALEKNAAEPTLAFDVATCPHCKHPVDSSEHRYLCILQEPPRK